MTTEELLKLIRIPPEYAHMGDTTNPSVQLERWRTEVATRLGDLGSHLTTSGSLSTEKQSHLVIHVAQHVGDDPWVSNDVRSRAEGTSVVPPPCLSEAHTPELTEILDSYVSQDIQLITHVLSSRVRPVFQSHVHPKVNPSTGRVLSRVAGGPLASQDLYTSQSWKESYPGISNVLFWVVARIKVKPSRVACCTYTSVDSEFGLRQALASARPTGHDLIG